MHARTSAIRTAPRLSPPQKAAHRQASTTRTASGPKIYSRARHWKERTRCTGMQNYSRGAFGGPLQMNPRQLSPVHGCVLHENFRMNAPESSVHCAQFGSFGWQNSKLFTRGFVCVPTQTEALSKKPFGYSGFSRPLTNESSAILPVARRFFLYKTNRVNVSENGVSFHT